MSATINGIAFLSIGNRVITLRTLKNSITSITGTNYPTGATSVPTTVIINVKRAAHRYDFNSPHDSKCVDVSIISGATRGIPVTGMSGNVTVTDVKDDFIQGTFEFTYEDSAGIHTVTNGQFSGKY